MARAALEPQGKWDALHADLEALYHRENLNTDGSFRARRSTSSRSHGVPRVTNFLQPHFDEPREHPGFPCPRARIGRQAGSERIGASLFAVPPGEAAYPYHWHLGEEEMLVVLEGTPLLRTADGGRRLSPGEVVSFPRGEEGAHQILNDTNAARFLPCIQRRRASRTS